MVATSSMNYRRDVGLPGYGKGTRGAICAVIDAGSSPGQFYRDNNCQPPLAGMQGIRGIDVAGHVAVTVAELASPGSRAHTVASSFIATYPNSHRISPAAFQPDLDLQ